MGLPGRDALGVSVQMDTGSSSRIRFLSQNRVESMVTLSTGLQPTLLERQISGQRIAKRYAYGKTRIT